MKRLLSGLLVVFFALSMTACNKDQDVETSTGLVIPGVDGPKMALSGDQLIISAVFSNIIVEGGLHYAIPSYPNSYVEVAAADEEDTTAGAVIAFTIDLDDLFGVDINELDPMTLPGGRALPGVSSGTLPAVAFSIPEWENAALYLGSDVFGVFIPVGGLNMTGSIITAKFYADGKRQGNISLVGEDANGENSGFLLLLDLDTATTKKLKYLANKY